MILSNRSSEDEHQLWVTVLWEKMLTTE